MPTGRSRNNKRSSSGSSYTSTITTIAFIAVCVVGVWMLTSNSIAPPQTTTRNSQATTSTTENVELSVTNEPQNINSEATENKRVQPVFEDNPGDLPADAIKSDVDPKTNDNNTGKQETTSIGGEENSSQGEKQNQISEESTVTEHQEAEKSAIDSSENGDTSSQEHQQNVESSKSSLDESLNPEVNAEHEQDKVQQQKQESENIEQNQNVKTYEDQQEQQRKEDAGIQTTVQEPPNEVSEEEQHERMKRQQQQQQEIQHEQQDQEQQRKEDAGMETMIQEPRNEVSEEDQRERMKQQQQEKQEQQHQQKEDAGIQATTQEPRNEVSEEDQHERMKQQQQQQQQEQEQKQQQDEQQLKQQQQQYDDQTSPGKEEHEDKRSKIQQESQGENTVSTQVTKQETTIEDKSNGETSLPGAGTTTGIPKESKESKRSWSTQAKESENEKERRKEEKDGKGYTWQLCNVTAGPDYIPCLDNEKAIKKLKTTKHFEHRERHCPEEGPTCLVQVPLGYKRPIPWPASRDKIWYHNVPHTKLAEVKGHQNWVKVTGEFLTFPGGGTQFIHGAMHYIEFLQQAIPNIKWGKHTRVILDVGCGVASFGGYLFEKDVLTMSFAPKDEHEAQVQFALERGIPAVSAVMGSQRLPFPSRVFDLLHCARCRVPWHADDGMLLLELNRLLRPGGYFVWSATPVYQKEEEDVEIWKAMSALTVAMCWDLVTIKKDKLNSIGAAIYRKPVNNACYDQRKKNSPPMCENNDDPNAAWHVPLRACMHRVPVRKSERGARWPEDWPRRIETPPYWLNSSQMGIYGKPAPQDFSTDYAHWQHVVHNSYMKGLGISWSNVRNIMDMRAVYGGFAAALMDLKVWVLNVVTTDSPDTLPIIYERGLFGIYHDWCESFSTYPRTFDLLHADHLFSKLKKRCKLAPVMAEVDRILRSGGKLIVRDESSAIGEVENILKSMHWEVHLTFSKDQEGLLSAQKGDWRPETFAAAS